MHIVSAKMTNYHQGIDIQVVAKYKEKFRYVGKFSMGGALLYYLYECNWVGLGITYSVYCLSSHCIILISTE
jgi:hypothetical protein